jgi:hypothetical protein
MEFVYWSRRNRGGVLTGPSRRVSPGLVPGAFPASFPGAFLVPFPAWPGLDPGPVPGLASPPGASPVCRFGTHRRWFAPDVAEGAPDSAKRAGTQLNASDLVLAGQRNTKVLADVCPSGTFARGQANVVRATHLCRLTAWRSLQCM